MAELNVQDVTTTHDCRTRGCKRIAKRKGGTCDSCSRSAAECLNAAAASSLRASIAAAAGPLLATELALHLTVRALQDLESAKGKLEERRVQLSKERPA